MNVRNWSSFYLEVFHCTSLVRYAATLDCYDLNSFSIRAYSYDENYYVMQYSKLQSGVTDEIDFFFVALILDVRVKTVMLKKRVPSWKSLVPYVSSLDRVCLNPHPNISSGIN